jgi:hypothetical protein
LSDYVQLSGNRNENETVPQGFRASSRLPAAHNRGLRVIPVM